MQVRYWKHVAAPPFVCVTLADPRMWRNLASQFAIHPLRVRFQWAANGQSFLGRYFGDVLGIEPSEVTKIRECDVCVLIRCSNKPEILLLYHGQNSVVISVNHIVLVAISATRPFLVHSKPRIVMKPNWVSHVVSEVVVMTTTGVTSADKVSIIAYDSRWSSLWSAPTFKL